MKRAVVLGFVHYGTPKFCASDGGQVAVGHWGGETKMNNREWSAPKTLVLSVVSIRQLYRFDCRFVRF